ncbi:MAG: CD1247 N-terminal domain-containing protein [Acutalibacteraceae bacterium]|jgi:ribosomal protein S27E
MTIAEKVAYLKGLFEGMQFDPDTNEGKLWKAVMDVLGDLALSVEDLEDYSAELSEQVDAIDEDLDQLESDFYEDYDYEEDEDGDDEIYEVTCPNCDEEFCVDEQTLMDGGVECPNCGEHLEFDLDEEDEDEPAEETSEEE